MLFLIYFPWGHSVISLNYAADKSSCLVKNHPRTPRVWRGKRAEVLHSIQTSVDHKEAPTLTQPSTNPVQTGHTRAAL